ncbi:MAG: DUF2007 domain-containing protein [Chloroflexi bacterium]|nr:DUF2007 domain-containing protein [Chloroflexota bacterium]
MSEMVRDCRLALVHTAYGQLEADVLKSHLEAEGIPVLLKYESASRVFGIMVDGLGKVHLWVPEDLADEAREVLKGAGQSSVEQD